MPKIAYLANLFPAAVEPYLVEEIKELRRRGVEVIPCSIRRTQPSHDATLDSLRNETLCLQAMGWPMLINGLRLAFERPQRLWPFLRRILFAGNESPARRMRALIHTWLGACYATLLADRDIDHIHVHHGYFGSWVAMVAAYLLGIRFSMTLHGSDLLIDPAYLDIKLEHCSFCVTVSEFNRWHILHHYARISAEKIYVSRMGVDCEIESRNSTPEHDSHPLQILCVGRLHPVKDHAFLVQACYWLKHRGLSFKCTIAGEGPERARLERLISALGLENEIRLAGHVPHSEIGRYYEAADLVVLTSRSEGIPLTLMEAMVRAKIVLAPAITGIPELVVDGKTGLLYRPESLHDFAAQVELVQKAGPVLGSLRRAARAHVVRQFNQEKNLAAFCDLLIEHLDTRSEKIVDFPGQRAWYEDPVLQ